MNDLPTPAQDETSYRALVEAITDYAIYMLDPSGRVTTWNAGAERLKGYRASEVIGLHFSRFYTPEDQATGLPARALETAAREGRFEHEGWRVRKDGGRFWAGVVIDPIHGDGGALIGFAKITRDLTERRNAELALRRSEEQFRLLVQGVTDYAIYRLDPTGRVESWNLGAERIKGYAEGEVVGEHFSRFYTPEDQEAGLPARSLETARREGRVEMEGWRQRKDGTRFRAHVIIDAIHDDQGELVGFAKVTRDVTERDATQQQLAEAREALFQSQKLEAIGQLTGGVAHDFNNLLMAIISSLELVQKRLPDDPQVRRLIDNAMLGAERGATLTQRMLAFARRQALKREVIDVPSLVRGMTGLLERALGASYEIQTRFPVGLPRVHTDAAQLETALLNLAVNARDAMPSGGVITIAGETALVTEGAHTGLVPGAYVCLCVGDTGEGMDKDTIARATEPFFTTKGVGKGTGLGLSMVHGLASQSGGALVVESELGKGTTVRIYLPVAVAEEALDAVAPAEPEKLPTRRLSVMAVDDDELVLLNTVAMLEELGHDVVGASSGAEALQILRDKGRADVVLTDQSMPGMTGLQLAEQVAAEWPRTQVILATGYADLPAGAGAELPRLGKPFGLLDLSRALDSLPPAAA